MPNIADYQKEQHEAFKRAVQAGGPGSGRYPAGSGGNSSKTSVSKNVSIRRRREGIGETHGLYRGQDDTRDFAGRSVAMKLGTVGKAMSKALSKKADPNDLGSKPYRGPLSAKGTGYYSSKKGFH